MVMETWEDGRMEGKVRKSSGNKHKRKETYASWKPGITSWGVAQWESTQAFPPAWEFGLKVTLPVRQPDATLHKLPGQEPESFWELPNLGGLNAVARNVRALRACPAAGWVGLSKQEAPESVSSGGHRPQWRGCGNAVAALLVARSQGSVWGTGCRERCAYCVLFCRHGQSRMWGLLVGIQPCYSSVICPGSLSTHLGWGQDQQGQLRSCQGTALKSTGCSLDTGFPCRLHRQQISGEASCPTDVHTLTAAGYRPWPFPPAACPDREVG